MLLTVNLVFQLHRLAITASQISTRRLRTVNDCQEFHVYLWKIPTFNVCATVCDRDGSVYLNAIPSILQMVYLTEPFHETICFLARITNVRNHFILDLLKKTKLFSFNAFTVTFFCVSKLLPRGSQEA